MNPATTPQVELPPNPPAQYKLPWQSIAWFGLLLVVVYFPTLKLLVDTWINDEDMGHGFFVPVLAAFIAWQKRDQVLSIKPQGSWIGLAIVILGALQLLVATAGVELFLARAAFLVSLTGAVIYLCGWKITKTLAFPLVLLLFMIPLPAIIYSRITLPLQLFASTVAEKILWMLSVPVYREGNILELASQTLSVAEACSGIRSLISLSFLSLIYGYFLDPKPWMKTALLIATIPIAILANALRVTLTGLISEYDTELAKGFFHAAEGWVIFMIALALVTLAHQVINWVYQRFRKTAV
jgi:exosortase